MSAVLGRTVWRRSTATVVLLVVCVSVCHSVDEDRTPTGRHYQRRAGAGRQRYGEVASQSGVSNCSSVHEFAVQTLHYSNELPVTKRHGTFAFTRAQLYTEAAANPGTRLVKFPVR